MRIRNRRWLDFLFSHVRYRRANRFLTALPLILGSNEDPPHRRLRIGVRSRKQTRQQSAVCNTAERIWSLVIPTVSASRDSLTAA